MFIPREGDLVRLYIQQGPDSDIIDPATGRADKTRTSPERLLEQAQKILKPYRMEIKDGKVDWWTVYVSESPSRLKERRRVCSYQCCSVILYSRTTRCDEVLNPPARIHSRRCMPYPFSEGRCVHNASVAHFRSGLLAHLQGRE